MSTQTQKILKELAAESAKVDAAIKAMKPGGPNWFRKLVGKTVRGPQSTNPDPARERRPSAVA